MLEKTRLIYRIDRKKFGAKFALSKFLRTLLAVVIQRLIHYKFHDKYAKLQNRISRNLYNEFNGTIRYGPFRDMRISHKSSWGSQARSSALLGIYELEVLSEMIRVSQQYKTIIDLGAADGYYAVGCVFSGIFERSFCYESSSKGRKLIEKNAQLNGVLDLVTIRGTATSMFHLDFSVETRNESVLLVDIEGGEFQILTNEVFEAFQKSVIIVEIHEWMIENGEILLKELENRAEKYFKIDRIRMGSRDPGVFRELEKYTDLERWIICSENREILQRWLIMSPK